MVSGAGDSACVASGAEVGLSSGAFVGAGVSVRIGVGFGGRVSGAGVGLEQAISAGTMTRVAFRSHFGTWSSSYQGSRAISDYIATFHVFHYRIVRCRRRAGKLASYRPCPHRRYGHPAVF